VFAASGGRTRTLCIRCFRSHTHTHAQLREIDSLAAITIHGRSAGDRYTKAADWNLVGDVVASSAGTVPIVGNGDILTHFEATQRLNETGVAGVMVARGALMKPWLFQEFRDKATWELSSEDRVEVYRRLVCYMKEHFGDDAKGRKKAFYFLVSSTL
jgi:tRNA-dihydrouridine synthase 3